MGRKRAKPKLMLAVAGVLALASGAAGAETDCHPKIETLAPMLLGDDFLRAHRVLVAHSQRRIYFTYGGGPVFVWAGAQPGALPSSPKEE